MGRADICTCQGARLSASAGDLGQGVSPRQEAGAAVAGLPLFTPVRMPLHKTVRSPQDGAALRSGATSGRSAFRGGQHAPPVRRRPTKGRHRLGLVRVTTPATGRHRPGAAPSAGGTSMKPAIAWPVVAMMMLGGVEAPLAGDLKDEVKIEIGSAGVHQGWRRECMSARRDTSTSRHRADPPLYPWDRSKVAGKVFDAEGKCSAPRRRLQSSGAQPNDKARSPGIPHRHGTAGQAGEEPGARGCRGGAQAVAIVCALCGRDRATRDRVVTN